MIYIGCHLSVADGYEAMGTTMHRWGGTTFAYFTRNPRGGKGKKIQQEDVAALNVLLRKERFGPLVAHASYTMNLCSANLTTRQKAFAMLTDDLTQMGFFAGNYYNFHPGCHVGQGVEAGIGLIVEALNKVLSSQTPTTVLLETMAGKGTELGGSFEELERILEQIKYPEKIGVCFDTCHTWDSGYDLANDLDGVLTHFDKVIGLDQLKAVHFNDSLNPRGSHKDRHARLGEGTLGLETLKRIATHPALQGRPFILETPNDAEGYQKEIALMREWGE